MGVVILYSSSFLNDLEWSDALLCETLRVACFPKGTTQAEGKTCGGLRLRQTDSSQYSSDNIKYSNHLQF